MYFIWCSFTTNQPQLEAQMMASGTAFFVGGMVVLTLGITSWIVGNAIRKSE
jgi:hypothetical protein